MFTILKTACTALLLLATATCSFAASSLPDQVARDFAPLSGYVVQSSGEEYLIDLGIGQGVAVGDLFTVVGPGATITHPVTGKVLGTEEARKGMLRLIRLKQGYSHSHPIGTVTGIKRGDVIHRFQDIPAIVWDYTGQGEQLAKDLQTALPHLNWQNYAATQQKRPASPTRTTTFSPALYFILTSQALEVRAPDFELIHRYPATTVSLPSQSAPTTAPTLTVLPPVTGGTVQTGGEPLLNFTSLKGTPIGIEAGDFDGDGRQEFAIAFADRIEIGRITAEGYQMMGAIRLAAGSQAYALDAVDLNNNGLPELYISAMNSNGNPAGIGIEFRDKRFRTTVSKISWHLRRVALPGEGDVLLAQEFDSRGREFAGPVFKVKRSGDQLVKGTSISLPKRVNLYGFAAFSSRGQSLYACIDDDGYLVIQTAKGEQLASSADTVGGTESYFEMKEEVANGGESRNVYLKGRVELTPHGNILVSANSGVSLLGRLKMYLKSDLKLFHWNGTNLREVWHTAPDKSYLADFKLINGKPGEPTKLATVVAFTTMNPLAERKAALRLYQLDTP
jgi:hypothetical protein